MAIPDDNVYLRIRQLESLLDPLQTYQHRNLAEVLSSEAETIDAEMNQTFFDHPNTMILSHNLRRCRSNRGKCQIGRETIVVCLLRLVEKITRIKNWMITLDMRLCKQFNRYRGQAVKECTFMTTCRPLSAKIRGANSEARYASRLYLLLVANKATAGGCSAGEIN